MIDGVGGLGGWSWAGPLSGAGVDFRRHLRLGWDERLGPGKLGGLGEAEGPLIREAEELA